MKLLTKKIKAKLLHNHQTFDYENCSVSNEKVVCKFFNPTGIGTWWCHSMDEHGIIFGLAHLYEKEYGSFSIQELEEVELPLGLSIERDLHFNENLTFEEVFNEAR